MPITIAPWTSPAPDAAHRSLQPVPLPVLAALGAGDLASARRLSAPGGPELTPYMVAEECSWVWELRASQIRGDPEHAVWVTRLIVDDDAAPTTTTGGTTPGGAGGGGGGVVGRAGFHGPPDGDGMVEVGYSVDPGCRRRGHARAALRIMVDAARGDPRVRVVRASVAPGNAASRALVESFGFVEVGEHYKRGGLEKLLELRVR